MQLRNFSCLLSLVIILFACTNNATDAPEKKDSDTAAVLLPENKLPIPATRCYAGVVGKDSFWLKTEVVENVVTGSIHYNFFEKDDNKGTFEGRVSGDTLFADYRFMAEGKESVRQVAFLVRDGSATEGYGDIEEKNGKMQFKDPAKINFSKGIKLQETSCVQ